MSKNKQNKKTASQVPELSPGLQKIFEQIEELEPKPHLLAGFDEHILGYDISTNAIIYDGYGIINQLTDERMKEDRSGEWEDYYDEAYDEVLTYLNRENRIDSLERGYPIVMLQFFT